MQRIASQKEYDVIIVGAGPAGSVCALSLKDSGLKVALIDQYIFPRDKICGDALPGPCLNNISKLVKDFRPEMVLSQKI